MSAQRVTPIQWLRALAATMVVAAHAANLVDAGPVRITGAFIPSVPNLAVVGISGVDLFFVISGFVMAQSLATAPRDPWGFLVQRWRRIVPLFALASIAYILVATEPQPVEAMLMSITVLPLLDGADYHQPSLYVGWTLGFEFAFYALVALAMTARHHRTRWLLASTLAVALVGCIVQPGWAPVRLLFNPMQLEFAFGLLVWIAWRRGITAP
ncbi:MAG: acyltransferase, partial [Sphingomonas sp.]